MNEPTADDWRRVWAALDAQRIRRGLSWRKLEKLGHVSLKTFYKMRDDGIPLASPAKRASLSRALGWWEDAIERLLAGEKPMTFHEFLEFVEADELKTIADLSPESGAVSPGGSGDRARVVPDPADIPSTEAESLRRDLEDLAATVARLAREHGERLAALEAGPLPRQADG